MKNYLFAIAVFLPMLLFAQNDAAKKTGYSEVAEVKNSTAKILTGRASNFLALKKIEAKTVGSVVSGTGIFNVSYPSVKKGFDIGHVKFNIKIMIKDGKYKMDLTDFRHEGIHGKSSGGSIDLEKAECGEAQIMATAWAAIKAQAQDQLKTFVKELKVKMDNPVKVSAPSSDF